MVWADVHADGVCHAVDEGGRGNDIKRASGLRSYDRSEFPSADEPVALEGQIVNGAGHEAMPDIEVGTATAAEDVRAVLNDDPLKVSRGVVNGVGPSVGSVELEATRKTLVGGDPQRIVGGVGAAVALDDVGGQSRARIGDAAGGQIFERRGARRAQIR